MSVLIDLFLELFTSGAVPSSDRGLVVASTISGLVLAVTLVWVVGTYPDPLREPTWALGVMAGAFILGAAGLLVSTLHLRRSEMGHRIAIVGAIANLIALSLSLLAVII